MAKIMVLGETILDYIDTVIQFFEIERKPISGIALNQFEWLQLINCVTMNYADCQTVVEFEEKKPTYGKYKGVHLYWDGSENSDDGFLYHMHDLKSRMENTRRRNTSPEEPEEATGSDIRMGMQRGARLFPSPAQVFYNPPVNSATPTRHTF